MVCYYVLHFGSLIIINGLIMCTYFRPEYVHYGVTQFLEFQQQSQHILDLIGILLYTHIFKIVKCD